MRLLAPIAAFAALSLPALAAADVVVAAEVAAASAETGFGVELAGTGVGLRLGWAVDLPLLRLEPELGVSRIEFDAEDCGSFPCAPVALTRAFAGARASLDMIVAPGVYVRAGAGAAKREGAPSRTGTIAEAGLFLDLRLLPWVEFGLHGGVGNPSFSNDAIEGTVFDAGAHLALVL